MAMRLQLPQTKYPKVEDRRAFSNGSSRNCAPIGGVEAIAVTTAVPRFPRGSARSRSMDARHARATTPGRACMWSRSALSSSMSCALPLRRGRAFNAMDGLPGDENVIINERLASQFFPGEDPFGRRIRFIRRNPASR